MAIVNSFDPTSLLDTLVSLVLAFVLGTLIGVERQYRQRTAGLRTNALVALAAAAFVDISLRLAGADGAVRVISYVVSGVGFLGAGVIMKEGMNVRGLNTAATLWASASVGACAGIDMGAEAVLITVLVIGGNTLLRPLAAAIDRIPIDNKASEAVYEVRIVTDPDSAAAARRTAIARLAAAQFPVSDLVMEPIGEARVEIVATLVNTSVDAAKLGAAVAELAKLPEIESADWEMSTSE